MGRYSFQETIDLLEVSQRNWVPYRAGSKLVQKGPERNTKGGVKKKKKQMKGKELFSPVEMVLEMSFSFVREFSKVEQYMGRMHENENAGSLWSPDEVAYSRKDVLLEYKAWFRSEH